MLKTNPKRKTKTNRHNTALKRWTYEVIADLGSGMNYHKKGLKRLLEAILAGNIGRLVLTHKDRLLRFGAELIFALCEAKQVEVVILNQGEDTAFVFTRFIFEGLLLYICLDEAGRGWTIPDKGKGSQKNRLPKK